MNLYLHIPFCAAKCKYCGFYSVKPSGETLKEYPHLLVREALLRKAETQTPPETVYFGGGTPGLLGAEGFETVFNRLKNDAGIDLAQAAEITVELNPASTTRDLLHALRRLNVTRLSFGVQSFNDATLARIGRLHTADGAREALSLAKAEGFADVGFDLIACLPEVGDAEWTTTLEEAIRFAPKHISVYGLIIEPDTPFAKAAEAGEITTDDEREMDLLRATEMRLAAAGFERYEISNYALPGYACRHNLAVWRGEDYTGLGPAASTRFGLTRRKNASDLGAYRAALHANRMPPTEENEILAAEDDATERFIYGLRLREGVSPSAFVHGHPAAAKLAAFWEQKLAALEKVGITEKIGNGGWRLTARGFEVCDAVAEALSPPRTEPGLSGGDATARAAPTL